MAQTITWRPCRRWIDFYRDAEYYRRLFNIALPIALQSFVMSSLSMVDVMMIGQLGETAVAAAGLAEQIFFLLMLLLFGVNSGMAMFTAQLWGKGDLANIRRVLGLALGLSLCIGLFFLALAQFFPAMALGIYSKDPAVVALGSQYLRIYGWSFVFYAITFSFAAVLRSIGEVRLPLAVSVAALSLNTLLGYLLIFGKFGLPAFGMRGGAIAVLVARILECAAMLWMVYRFKTPVAARLSELFNFDLAFVVRVIGPVLPVAANEMLWALGITTYSVIYARIGTESIAAMSIVNSINSLALVIFRGVAHACAVLVGNLIGANQERQAFRYAARSLSLGMFSALGVGGLILLGGQFILPVYKVTPLALEYVWKVLIILALLLWLRVANMILLVGILRSGGDTKFGLLLDGVVIWVLGVPLGLIGAFVFHLPVYWVYLLVMSEELVKLIIGLWRFFSRRWIHNLAQTV